MLATKRHTFAKLFTFEQLQQGYHLMSLTKQLQVFNVTLRGKKSSKYGFLKNLMDMQSNYDR